MRPKFRAWDDEVNHMYYPPNSHIAMWCNGECINLQTSKRLIPLFWTGLYDRNKKEIWEGDILKYISSKCPYCGCEHTYEGHKAYQIIWIKEECCFECKNEKNNIEPEGWGTDMEVIGNIYENSDLLKEDAKRD